MPFRRLKRANNSKLAANASERKAANVHHGVTPVKLSAAEKGRVHARTARKRSVTEIFSSSEILPRARRRNVQGMARSRISEVSNFQNVQTFRCVPCNSGTCRIRPPASFNRYPSSMSSTEDLGYRSASKPPIFRKICFHTAPQPAQKLETSPRIF